MSERAQALEAALRECFETIAGWRIATMGAHQAHVGQFGTDHLARIAAVLAAVAPPVGVSPQQVQRFDLVSVNFAYTSDHEMERADDGEWVRFDDVFPLTSLSPVEPKPPVHNDLCSWCLTQADHVAASEECYERNSERGRSVPKPPVEPTPDTPFNSTWNEREGRMVPDVVEPTPPAEDEDDDEVPVARAEGAPDAWSAPLRKPVVPKTPHVETLRQTVGMAGAFRQTLLTVRECIDALTPGHRTGYDWNADPLYMTRYVGDALKAIDAGLKSLSRVEPAPPTPAPCVWRVTGGALGNWVAPSCIAESIPAPWGTERATACHLCGKPMEISQ